MSDEIDEPAPFSLRVACDTTIPQFLLKEVRGKLAYLDELVIGTEVSATGDAVTLLLRREVDAASRARLAAKTNGLVTSMADGAFEPLNRVLEDFTDRPTPYGPDPTTILLDRGELFQEGPGFYALGPLMSRLIDFMERRFLVVAADMGAAPYRFPALLSPDYMERVKYFTNFPHSLSFVTHLREDLEVISRFADEAACRGGGVVAPEDAYAAPPAMLSPTVCHHLYHALSDHTVPAGGLTATAAGHCFRYESSNMVSLERLWNFTMREIIFVGSEDYVADRLDDIRRRVQPVFADMGLAYRVETATDPFFVDTHRDQSAYQNAYELKFEILATLPFKNDCLAAGSYNRHRDFFGRTLAITADDGAPAHTGCVGFGFERLAFAFVAQHGPDPASWPAPVKDHLEAAS